MLLAAALNYDAAAAASNALRDTLLPITYLLCFLGFVECVYRSHGDGERILMFFISIACVVILAANFPTGINLLKNGINSMMDTHNEHVNNLFYQILNANLSNEPSMWDVGNYILYGIIKLLQGIGRCGIIIIEMIQTVSLLALVAISPILIGMLATSWTRSAGVRFLMTSLIICMWSIGIALVDLVLFAIGQYVFAAALGAGAAGAIGTVGAGTAAGVTLTTLALPAVLLAVGLATFVPIALYLSIPIVMHSVMLGANPLTSSLSAGAGIAGTAIGISSANAARAASTAAGMAASRGAGGGGGGVGAEGQSMSQPASQTLAPIPSSSTAGDSAPESGVVRSAAGAYSAAPGASYSAAPAGQQAEAPGGGMLATQINSDAFSVSTSSGAARDFQGNIGHPQDLAAAYNTMLSAAPRPPSSSTTTTP
jgi:hypothetical protein